MLLLTQVQVVAGKHNLFIEEPEQQVAKVQVSDIFSEFCIFCQRKAYFGPKVQFDILEISFQGIKIHPDWDKNS